ncbi:16S rRNA (adenine(1518)-N(6)/adenine(1519)-N(6))-dimethyltransferase RsmA [Motiliproteus sp.]|uniref:16S rRNA (adenine(1518)-N(6)/adenine(1519)-N(6))- dimethyltransferase RsmA n=1 Tax=Motiliproteus sp. TaxID=1898955 RepID=UPI003BA9AECC
MKQSPLGHQARKRFGQNFLQNPGVIRRIIRAIHPKPGQHLVEIGPGLGALTEELLAAAGELDVVELDRDLIPILRTQFFRYEQNFRIHEADALKFDFGQLATDERPLRVVGNLPYNISTPLIFHLLSHSGLIEDMYFMLQKEVVERLAAQPGESAYGRLSIMAQYYCEVSNLFLVGPEAFHPKPKVDSAIVKLKPYPTPPHLADNPKDFETLVRTAFTQRRKTLRNNLKQLLPVELIEAVGIDPGIRPERISLPEFVTLANRYSLYVQQSQSEPENPHE